MTNYIESEVPGSKWTRCNKVTIANPFKDQGFAIFSEESVVPYEDATGLNYIKEPVRSTLTLGFSEDAQITMYDPETGEPLPASITHKEVYQIIYSMYRNAAQLRDLGFVQPPLVI